MRIKECKFIKHIAPNMSSGTGYSEYDVFLVTLDDGRTKKVNVEMWYVPEYATKSRVREELERQMIFDMGDHIDEIIVDNIDEVYEMMYGEHMNKQLTSN